MSETLIKNILSQELFGGRLCESLEDWRLVDYLYKEMLLEKLLFGEPITVPELRKILRQRIVNFEFIKLDGEIRPAKGTTMMKYIPNKDHPKGIRPSSPKVATFFDMDKTAWRSVSQRSKEIVLKKDEEKNRPIVVVKDKEKHLSKADITAEREDIKVGEEMIFKSKAGDDLWVKIIKKEDNGDVYVENTDTKVRFMVPKERVGDIRVAKKEDEEKRIKVGEERVYTSKSGEDIKVKILRKEPSGGVYVEDIDKKVKFMLPKERVKNIK